MLIILATFPVRRMTRLQANMVTGQSTGGSCPRWRSRNGRSGSRAAERQPKCLCSGGFGLRVYHYFSGGRVGLR